MARRVTTVQDLTIDELQTGDELLTGAMIQAFTTLMPEYAHYVDRLLNNIQRPYGPHSRDHVWLVRVGGQPAGMCAFEYLPHRDLGLAMDVAVYPAYRRLRYEGRSLAHFLITEMSEQLCRDAREAGRTTRVPMAGEVAYPRLLARYREYGFVDLPIVYYEPPDVSGRVNPQPQPGVDPRQVLEASGYQRMVVGVMPPVRGAFDPRDYQIWRRVMRAFYVDHYRLPGDALALQVALDSIDHQRRGLPQKR